MRLPILILIAAIVCPFSAHSDSYEGYGSTIEGIGLWLLEPAAAGKKVIRRLEVGANPEFATYCDGKNELFVYELSSRGFRCQVERWEEFLGWDSNDPWKSHDATERKEFQKVLDRAKKGDTNARDSKYFVSLQGLEVKSEGFFTVSKKRLVRGSWTVSALTKDEQKIAMALAAQHKKDIRLDTGSYSYKSVLGVTDGKIRPRHRPKSEVYTIKIEREKVAALLIPTLYQYGLIGDEDLISSVILRDSKGYRFVGHVTGCLLAVGADIDSDGFPELIFDSCVGGEGYSAEYQKIYPQIKSLIDYEHN